jgi:hypothetical protein
LGGMDVLEREAGGRAVYEPTRLALSHRPWDRLY